MKGLILAGGTGSRLYPLTKVTNKHLLPVYNKPMIYFPLFTMKRAGIKEVMIVSGKGHSGSFLELLGSGSQLGMKLTYEVQEEALGIAHAISLAENFINQEKFMVVLGDNIVENSLVEEAEDFEKSGCGAKIFLKSVKNPSSYGVAYLEDGKIKKIIEKPKNPESDLAVTGVYMYDKNIFDLVRQLKPSARNEFEITDVNNAYLQNNQLCHSVLDGFWGDCGESFDSLMVAAALVKNSDLANLSNELNLV